MSFQIKHSTALKKIKTMDNIMLTVVCGDDETVVKAKCNPRTLINFLGRQVSQNPVGVVLEIVVKLGAP